MHNEELTAYLAEGLEQNLAAHNADPGGIQEAAYFALENGGLLRRIRPAHRLLTDLEARPPEARALLASMGCAYVSGFTLADRASALLARENFDDDHLDEFRSLLLRRDALEATLHFAADLTHDVPGGAKVRIALLNAREVAARIDDVLCQRLDVLCVAARVLTPAADSPPWLERSARLDRIFEAVSFSHGPRVGCGLKRPKESDT